MKHYLSRYTYIQQQFPPVISNNIHQPQNGGIRTRQHPSQNLRQNLPGRIATWRSWWKRNGWRVVGLDLLTALTNGRAPRVEPCHFTVIRPSANVWMMYLFKKKCVLINVIRTLYLIPVHGKAWFRGKKGSEIDWSNQKLTLSLVVSGCNWG